MTQGKFRYYVIKYYLYVRGCMKKTIYSFLFIVLAIFFSACQKSSVYEGSVEEDRDINLEDVNSTSEIIFGESQKEIPTLVIVMNWDNYSQTDPLLWYNKIFNQDENSVNRWYYDSTDANIEFVPISENSGTIDDGVIIVDMGKNHPGGDDDISFRDTELKNAITSDVVVDNVDFDSLDIDGDGALSHTELQIIFVVSGGEQSYGDSAAKSIWAHAWAFDSDNAPVVDTVSVMKADANATLGGTYMRFGATHGVDTDDEHLAVIGIIAHELGHSLLNLLDLYDSDGEGSGLGYYDIMSGGSWASKSEDTYDGQTPVQFSAFSKIDSNLDLNISEVNSASSEQNITIKCSSNEIIKLATQEDNEYFLLECRDTARVDSDKSFDYMDSNFTDNKLVSFIYHIDTNKTTNDESGSQTQSNHYRVALVEKDSSDDLTLNENIRVHYNDSYEDGETIDSNKTKSYDGSSGYEIEIESSNYTDRTMTFIITQ